MSKLDHIISIYPIEASDIYAQVYPLATVLQLKQKLSELYALAVDEFYLTCNDKIIHPMSVIGSKIPHLATCKMVSKKGSSKIEGNKFPV